MKTTLRSAIVVAVFSSLALAGASAPVFATDLGVQSKVWPITETDIRVVVLQQIAQAHLDGKLSQLQTQGKNYLNNLPPRALPLAEKTETSYMDPSIQLANDINAPVKAIDGSYTWQTLYHKGMKVNPLENQRFATSYLFFDGSNLEQRTWAANLAADPLNRVMPIDTTGTDFVETAKAFGRPVFYATDQLLERLHVTKTPTLVYQGEGQYSLYMAITTFSRPYTPDAFHQFWPDHPVGQAARNSNSGAKQ
jgi:hypothetical protein